MTNAVDNRNFLDPLLECLLALAKYYGRNVSPYALEANLPLVDNRLTPELFVQAAERIQLSARIVERKLESITSAVLPAVLLLNDNQACVLVRLYDDGSGEVISPQKEGESSIIRLTIDEINKKYTGIAIYAKPVFHFEERADEYNVQQPKSWFWDTIWRYRYLYYRVAIASILINCFIMATPLYVMNVYDRVVPNQTMQTLWALTIGIIFILIFDFILKMLRGYFIDVSGKNADVILTNELFRRLLELQMSSKPISAGSFSNNFHGFEAVRDFYTSATLVSFIDLPFIFLFILIIALIGGWLALIPLLAIPVIILVSWLLEAPIRTSVEEIFVGESQKHAILVETINRLETIKTSLAENLKLRKWEYYTGRVAKLGLKSRFYSSFAVNFASYVLQMVYVLVIVVGVYEINANTLTLGGLIACSILASRTLAPLTQIASLITRYYQAKIGLKSLNRIMELPVERTSKKEYLHRPQLKGDIQFYNVSFQYPNQQIPALSNISLKINPNEKVAILGRMGSGKTTLLKLILDLYSPTTGYITLDNINLEQLDPVDIRRNIGYVPQECNLFYGTLRENMTMSAPWSSSEELMHVAKITGINYYLDKHPTGFDLMIGENGAGLSQGQQQCVAIARALLPNPPIIIFDDATSEMDDNTENELRENIQDYLKDKTFVMVTHKLSMLSLVNRIIIIDNGRITLDGPKSDVLKTLVH